MVRVGVLLSGCGFESTTSGSDVLLGGFSARVDGEVELAFRSGATALAELGIQIAPLRERVSETTVFVEGSELLVRFEPHPDDPRHTLVTAQCRCEWTVPAFLLDEIGRQAERDGVAFHPPGLPSRDEDDLEVVSSTLETLRRRQEE